jgi:hypothetical protein
MRRSVLLLAVAAVLAPLPGGAGAAVREPGDQSPLGTERLSDERTVTRWAHPATTVKVRTRPSTRAASVTRLRHLTEDRMPEVYLVLSSRRVGEQVWLKVRLPMRPNGRTGWVRREALGPLNTVTTFLRVDRRTLRATLLRDGQRIWTSRIGVGAPSTPTPAGRFWIREKMRAMGGVYGPYALGTSAYSVLSDWPGGGVVGIHGTNEPQRIPGRPSHGCVRVPNRAITRLAKLVPIGTPVRIL